MTTRRRGGKSSRAAGGSPLGLPREEMAGLFRQRLNVHLVAARDALMRGDMEYPEGDSPEGVEMRIFFTATANALMDLLAANNEAVAEALKAR